MHLFASTIWEEDKLPYFTWPLATLSRYPSFKDTQTYFLWIFCARFWSCSTTKNSIKIWHINCRGSWWLIWHWCCNSVMGSILTNQKMEDQRCKLEGAEANAEGNAGNRGRNWFGSQTSCQEVSFGQLFPCLSNSYKNIGLVLAVQIWLLQPEFMLCAQNILLGYFYGSRAAACRMVRFPLLPLHCLEGV